MLVRKVYTVAGALTGTAITAKEAHFTSVITFLRVNTYTLIDIITGVHVEQPTGNLTWKYRAGNAVYYESVVPESREIVQGFDGYGQLTVSKNTPNTELSITGNLTNQPNNVYLSYDVEQHLNLKILSNTLEIGYNVYWAYSYVPSNQNQIDIWGFATFTIEFEAIK